MSSENYKEWYESKYPELRFRKAERFFRKPELPETKTRKMIEKKYTSRNNICQVCFIAKSTITGECNC